MIEAYKDFWKRYADFNGKSTRSQYWYSVLCNSLIFLIFALIVIVSSAVLFLNGPQSSDGTLTVSYQGNSLGLIVVFGILYLLALAFLIAIVVPSLAVSVRRLHDANLPGGLIFLVLIPLGGIALIILHCQPSKEEKGSSEGMF